ncbi:hypothetical protein HYH02_015261 [Chlamydomonas schloesseri]|uniref:Uncharacterized protein n=1 Tax=Chlamydomonas schloesseri TaxID=2026947 RepID=A0A835SAX2_9CHLO|nr:hypothetical protein HYH02_015261 [Chlamydomonas schloesseri]|eukprot:KAG2423922.1 hypothetical protein HYH02_015261 [Chlamydomonas schloesseri]
MVRNRPGDEAGLYILTFPFFAIQLAGWAGWSQSASFSSTREGPGRTSTCVSASEIITMGIVGFLGFYISIAVISSLSMDYIGSEVGEDVAATAILAIYATASLALGFMYIREAMSVM